MFATRLNDLTTLLVWAAIIEKSCYMIGFAAFNVSHLIDFVQNLGFGSPTPKHQKRKRGNRRSKKHRGINRE
jgi:hypothetical protein